MRPSCDGRIWASQGGLSRNKVGLGESGPGSPPLTGTGPTCPAHFRLPALAAGIGDRSVSLHNWTVRAQTLFGGVDQMQLAHTASAVHSVRLRTGHYRGRERPFRDTICTIPRKRGWEGYDVARSYPCAFR